MPEIKTATAPDTLSMWNQLRDNREIFGKVTKGGDEEEASIGMEWFEGVGNMITMTMPLFSHTGWDYFDFKHFVEKYEFMPEQN